MARSGIVYWDATGSILSHRDDKFKYYYYELACSNPVKGQPAIPVSSLISSLHSTSLVRFWLAEFRRAEKKLFGHANASIPHQVNSDRSMAFIQAHYLSSTTTKTLMPSELEHLELYRVVLKTETFMEYFHMLAFLM